MQDMEHDNLPEDTGNKREKFFFDMNSFDPEEEVEEELLEDLPPPPPVFSEEELEAARQEAFAKGKEEGLAEAAASRSQALATTLHKLTADTVQLFELEAQREATYAQESIKLTVEVFEKIFPITAEQHGFNELQQALNSVLANHNGKSVVSVKVAETVKDGVEQFLQKLSEKDNNLKFKVIGDETLEEQACILNWEDGGFVRNPAVMAEEIKKILEAPLAKTPAKGDDSKSDEETASAQDPAEKSETSEDVVDNPMEQPDE